MDADGAPPPLAAARIDNSAQLGEEAGAAARQRVMAADGSGWQVPGPRALSESQWTVAVCWLSSLLAVCCSQLEATHLARHSRVEHQPVTTLPPAAKQCRLRESSSSANI